MSPWRSQVLSLLPLLSKISISVDVDSVRVRSHERERESESERQRERARTQVGNVKDPGDTRARPSMALLLFLGRRGAMDGDGIPIDRLCYFG